MIQSVNPVNGKLIRKYKSLPKKLLTDKIKQTDRIWQEWRNTSFRQRASLLQKTARILEQGKRGLAELMAAEMGKPVKDGIAEIEKCASVCTYYANHGAAFLQDEHIKTDARKSYVSYQPLGVILAVMPWNFPFWQCFRFLAPALMAGNCCLLKHASNVPGCALAIEQILLQAGFPRLVFQTLLIGSKDVETVIKNDLIKAVSLTGSTEAGRQVAMTAGAYIKKTVLELGGSDAYVILQDADLELAATVCANSRLINNGQSCIAAKRFIVVKQVEKRFISLLKEKMQQKKIGDPFLTDTDLGPMARVDLRDELHVQVTKTIRQGANCILGGAIPDYPGQHAFYEPTILTGIKKGMVAYEQELFGPVACVITAKNEMDAIRIANDSVFGLGAAIFSKNVKKAEKLVREELQAGACFVNSMVKSDPRLPFGGINQSGYGRELGPLGIKEFVNAKTVCL